MASYYEILEIAPNANKDQIKLAIMKRMNHLNEQILDTSNEVIIENINAQIKTINIIRDTLMNDAKRHAYDLSLTPEMGGRPTTHVAQVNQEIVETFIETSVSPTAKTTIQNQDYVITGGTRLGGILLPNSPFVVTLGKFFSPLSPTDWVIVNEFYFNTGDEFRDFLELIKEIRLETLQQYVQLKNGIESNRYKLSGDDFLDYMTITKDDRPLNNSEHQQVIDYYQENANLVAQSSQYVTYNGLTVTFAFKGE